MKHQFIYESGNSGGGGGGGGTGIIGPALGFIGGMMNMNSQKQENNWARNFAADQATQQHNWAIDDWLKQNQWDATLWNNQNAYNLEMWNMQNSYNMGLWNKQNEYNSPAAQMQRYKDAGLNPNLIYGQQNTGGGINASTLNTSDTNTKPVRNVSGSSPSFGHPANYDFISQVVPTLMGVRQQEATIDLTRAQTEATREEASLKSIQQLVGLADVDNKKADWKLKDQDYSFKSELNPISLQAQRLANIKLSHETESIIQSIQESGQRIEESKQRVSSSKDEQRRENEWQPTRLELGEQQRISGVNSAWRDAMDAYGKDLQNKAIEAGVNPNESWLFRKLGDLLDRLNKSGKPNYYK